MNSEKWSILDSKVKETTKSRKQVRKLHLTASRLKRWRRHLKIQEVENITFDAPVKFWRYYTWRRQVLLEVGRLVQNLQEMAQKWFERDAARRLNYATRKPNDSELTTSELITWRRHLCKSRYSFQVFIHKRGLMVGNFRVRTLVDFCSYFGVSNPLFFHVQLKISYPLIIQYVYVLFDYIVCFSFV